MTKPLVSSAGSKVADYECLFPSLRIAINRVNVEVVPWRSKIDQANVS